MGATQPRPTNNNTINQIPVEENEGVIKLNNRKLTDQDMPDIVRQAIQEKQCTYLDLQDNEFTWEGMSILVPALKENPNLQTLYLHSNRLSDKGIYTLAELLTSNNHALKILGLNSTGLTDVGAEDLGVMLQKNSTLTHLELEANDIGDRGMLYLAETLMKHNTTLEQLNLAKNKPITDSSVDLLVELIQQNRPLKVLNLSHCGITSSGKAKLQEAIESNKDLQLLL